MRKLLWFSIGFACACLLTVYFLPPAALPWAAPAMAGAAAVWFLPRLRAGVRADGPAWPILLRICRVLALGLAVGLIWCWGFEALVLDPARSAAGRYEDLTAQLCDDPVQTPYGHRADAYVTAPAGRFKARLYLYGPLPDLAPGDWISGSFTLRRADRSADGETYLDLQARGIPLIASGRAASTADGGAPLRFLPARFSRIIFDRLGALIPADAAGLPQAMLTGCRDGLTETDRDDLSAAGATHIVAVSGLHVTMLMTVLVLLVGQGRRTVFLGIPLLALFVLMTGASPSVVRAALMLSLLLIAPLFREENDPPTALALAGLLILLENPWAAANVSFQLSFAAVAGLLLITRPLQTAFLTLPWVKRLLRWQGPKHWPRLCRNCLLRTLRRTVRAGCTGLAASLGALLFTTPIAAAVFGSVPVYGVLTNLFVLPLAGVCLAGALAVLAIGLVSTALGSWAGWVLAWPVRGVFAVCRLVSRLPGHLLRLDGYGMAFLIFAGLLFVLSLLLRERQYGKTLLCLLTALAAAVGLQILEARTADFTLAALDVGQGQCVCMVTDGFTVMTDCGGTGGPTVGVTAAEWLRRKGAERLDALILTHYDTDHMGGVEALLSRIPVKTVYLPDVPFDPGNRAAVEQAALAAGAALRYVTQDSTLSCPGVQIRLFAPVSDRSDNAACVCVLYSVGEYDMLITGDLDAEGEYALLERQTLPRVEVYAAGHHGSAGSSTQALLDAIRPETVLISVGRNSYGLPSPETLNRLQAGGARVFRTDECGNLEIGR